MNGYEDGIRDLLYGLVGTPHDDLPAHCQGQGMYHHDAGGGREGPNTLGFFVSPVVGVLSSIGRFFSAELEDGSVLL